MGSLNSDVQAELGLARATNASHLLFGRSQFPEIARLLAAHDLTDFEWRVIEPRPPNKPRGFPRVDDRRVLNGIFWAIRRPLARSPRALRPAHHLLRPLRARPRTAPANPIDPSPSPTCPRSANQSANPRSISVNKFWIRQRRASYSIHRYPVGQCISENLKPCYADRIDRRECRLAGGLSPPRRQGAIESRLFLLVSL